MKRTGRLILSLLLTAAVLTALFGCGKKEATPVLLPEAKVRAKTLLLTDYPAPEDALTLASLQGVLANVSETQILIKDGAYEKYLPYMNADIKDARPDGSPWDTAALLAEYGPLAQGYVLCDDAGATAAVSVAGALQAVIIPESMQAKADAADLAMLADVRGWDDKALRGSEYFDKLHRQIAVEQPVDMAPKLVDLAVMEGVYFGFSDTDNAKAHTKTFDFLDDNAVIFGWNNILGEHDTVESFSGINACMIPADHGCNYSVLSGFAGVEFKQKTEAAQTPDAPRHTVCLVMTDGDNMQWMTSSFANAPYFGSPVRGSFPMGWGISAVIDTVAAPMTQYLFDNMTPNDEFVTQISGLGYTFPSKWKNKAALAQMAAQLDAHMKNTDTTVAVVLDDGGFRSPALDTILSQQNISALFYFDYGNYAGDHGAVRKVDGKPIIAARYRLWNNREGSSPEEIAASINAASDDPADLDSYSLVAVHAWSGLDKNGGFIEGGDTMAAAQRLVNALNDDVLLVTPGEFAQLVSQAE